MTRIANVNLTSELDGMKAQFMAKVSPDIASVMMQATRALELENLPARAVTVGRAAPEFSLPDVHGKLVSLSTLLTRGPVVISFYRGGWCPYCNLELRALNACLDDIQALGANLVAISPQTPDQSLSTAEKQNLRFAVLSDKGNVVARSYGLVFTLPERLRPIYQSFGIDVPASNGDTTWELPLPATYVVDQRGVIRADFLNADYTRRMEPADIIAALRSIRGNA